MIIYMSDNTLKFWELSDNINALEFSSKDINWCNVKSLKRIYY